MSLPAVTYIDDAYVRNPRSTKHAPAQQQWRAAAAALTLAVSVSFLVVYYLSRTKSDLMSEST